MERVKYNKVEVCHGDSQKKFPVYEIYLDGVIVTKVSSESDALEMVSRWQEIYNLNRDKISNPNLIYPGQVLALP